MTTTRVHEGAIVDVEITGIDDEARGRATLATVNGEHDVAVRGALPGDVVTARVDRVWPARNLSQARAVSFAARSALHVARTCPHDAPCPGCPFEGVDAGFALAFKRARVEQALIDAGLEGSVGLIDDVTPSRAPRQKAKWSVGGYAGALRFGLFVPHSHHLVDTDECPHVAAPVLDAIALLADALDEALVPPATIDARGLKAIVAREFLPPPGGYSVAQALRVGVVLVMGADVDDRTWRTLTSVVGVTPPGDAVAPWGPVVSSLALRVDDSGGNSIVGGRVARTIGPQAMNPIEGGPEATVDAFCQPDAALAVEMYKRAARFLAGDDVRVGQVSVPATFVDAYAGAGGFARTLVDAAVSGAVRVIAIERADEGVRTLRTLDNVEAIASSVEDALPELTARGPFAGVVADPPKSGLRDAARGLASLHARRFVLVACDPDAGARDAKTLVDAGYTLVRVEPIDLFPATAEIETMFFFTR